MYAHIMADVAGETQEIKGLVSKASHLKTKTKLELQFDKESRAQIDIFNGIRSDIQLLGIQAIPVTSVMLTIEGAPSVGRLINRSAKAFGRIGFEISTLDWEDRSGVVEIKGILPLIGTDLAPLMDVIARMVMRSIAPISKTHHPLTLYDFKQITGLIYDSEQGDNTAAIILTWFDVRELVILEEEKTARALVIAERRQKAAVKRAEDRRLRREKDKIARIQSKLVGPEKNWPEVLTVE